MDAFGFAEIDDFLLGQEWVVLDLVGSRDDGCLCEELLHVLYGVVCDADSLDFVGVRLDEFLHVLPCLDVGDAVVDVAGAVFEFGEEGVVSFDTVSACRKWGARHIPLGFMGTGQWTR